MSTYPREQLEEMRLKNDVVNVAEDLGISIEGTRAQITDRILEFQETVETEPEPVDESETEVESVEAFVSASEIVLERVEKLPEIVTPPHVEQPEQQRPSLPFSEKALAWAAKALRSYVGVDYTSKLETRLFTALRGGHQPCVVTAGKRKFNLVVCLDPFEPGDYSKDAVVDGAVLNIARRMVGARLYPKV